MSNVSTASPVDQEQYAAKFKQLDAEALYTFLGAIFITVVFWLSIFLTHDSEVAIMQLPLWFVLSCLGGYVLSVLVVIFLVKFLLKHTELKVMSYREAMAAASHDESSKVANSDGSHAKAQDDATTSSVAAPEHGTLQAATAAARGVKEND